MYLSAMLSAKRSVYTLKTLYLFTKADIKVCILPITCLAVACAPLSSIWHLPHIVFWIWLECLELALSNQTLNPEEDALNKPHRPIPSGRISLKSAKRLRWIMPIICWAWSASYGKLLLLCSILTSIIIVIYDEMGLAAGHWMNRNIMNVVGHACVQYGACLLANDINGLDVIATQAIWSSAAVIMCTIHAQDFKDAIGDAQTGRRTIPVIYPEIARPTLMLAITSWSLILISIWQLPPVFAILFLTFGIFIGGRFIFKRTKSDDTKSLSLYMAWLSAAQMLPAYYRYYHAAAR